MCCISTGTLDPTKVGSGVQMGEMKSGGVVVDTDDGAAENKSGCAC